MRMNLSTHFSIAEMTKTSQKLDNTPSEEILKHLKYTAEQMELVRALFGKPITINSGFRSEAVNKAVGGSKTSQHCSGAACDFEIEGISNYDLAKKIADSDIQFDQLILEMYTSGQPSSGWVHCSFVQSKPRKQILTATKINGKVQYLAGLVK